MGSKSRNIFGKIPDKTINKMRLSTMSDFLSEMLQEALYHHIRPSEIYQKYKMCQAAFMGRNKLSQDQVDKLKDAESTKSYSELDVSLLYTLFRNLSLPPHKVIDIESPREGWGNDPSDKKCITVGDALERIRNLRGEKSHDPKDTTSEEFEILWDQYESVTGFMQENFGGSFLLTLHTLRYGSVVDAASRALREEEDRKRYRDEKCKLAATAVGTSYATYQFTKESNKQSPPSPETNDSAPKPTPTKEFQERNATSEIKSTAPKATSIKEIPEGNGTFDEAKTSSYPRVDVEMDSSRQSDAYKYGLKDKQTCSPKDAPSSSVGKHSVNNKKGITNIFKQKRPVPEDIGTDVDSGYGVGSGSGTNTSAHHQHGGGTDHWHDKNYDCLLNRGLGLTKSTQHEGNPCDICKVPLTDAYCYQTPGKLAKFHGKCLASFTGG